MRAPGVMRRLGRAGGRAEDAHAWGSDLCACVPACLCVWSRGGGEMCGAEGVGKMLS